MAHALSCGPRMRLSISFLNCIRTGSPAKAILHAEGAGASLILVYGDVNKEKQRELYTSPQVEIVRDIHKRLISNLQERPTIEELSKEYLINTAT